MIVGIANLLTVRRPHRPVEERAAAEIDLLDIAHAILAAQVQGIFAGFVGKVSDPLAVRRPRRVAFHHVCCVGQIARVAFFGRHADDLAARFKDGACARRRNRCVRHAIADFLKVRAHRQQVAVDANADRAGFAVLQVVKVNRAELLVSNRARPRRRPLEIKPVVLDELIDLLRFGVVSEQRHRARAVRQKVNLITNPHWEAVVGIFARQLFDR